MHQGVTVVILGFECVKTEIFVIGISDFCLRVEKIMKDKIGVNLGIYLVL